MAIASTVQKVGFVALDEIGSVAFPEPRLLRSSRTLPLSRRAVQACPAVNALERRIIEILAPFSLQIRAAKNSRGGYDFNLIEGGTRIDQDVLPKFLSFMPREIWRNENCPVIQISLPHLIISDLPLHVTQMPPWASGSGVMYPGQFIGGRFPADVWPRALNLAFEWSDIGKDFKMVRGQPACYLFLETVPADASVELVRCNMTSELRSYMAAIQDVVKFTSGSFGLFEKASQIRPKKLLSEAQAINT